MTEKVHMVGICGSGMSSIALWYRSRGLDVTGCDRNPGENLPELEEAGIKVYARHDPEHVRNSDRVVFSAAVPFDHMELQTARDLGIPVFRRSEALARLANSSRLLAVAGAHGKTTVTAMIGWILQETGHNPTVMLGGSVRPWKGNFRRGGKLSVVEADEYDRTFLRLRPSHSAVTSYAAEHLECYGTEQALSMAYGIFLEMTRPGGTVVVPAENRDLSVWAERIGRKVIATGPEGDFNCRHIQTEGWQQEYELEGKTGVLPMPGRHNLRNASTAMALARAAGAGVEEAMKALKSFPGISRRLEKLGRRGSVDIVSDYAHHPDEIEAALKTVKDIYKGTAAVVFQPHLYSRTAAQYQQMGSALSIADDVMVLPIYPAREEPLPGVTSELVVKACRQSGGTCSPVYTDEAIRMILELDPEVVVFMGAGSVDSLAREMAGDPA